jgi:glycosyltransferase involved in cell wall biosynthesis
MKRKVLTIIQDISRAQEHEWVVKYIDRSRFEMHFALINCRNTVMEQFLHDHMVPVWHFSYGGKRDLPLLTIQLAGLCRKHRFDSVHTHLFEASLAGLVAAWFTGTRQRIYTRHYSDYHHVWFPAAVKYDRFINRIANRIVATSENVKDILVRLEHVPVEKITVIRHGIDMSDYETGAVSQERVESIRKKYHIPTDRPVVGAISRFTELKGLQYLIPAFKGVLEKFPDAMLVMANASGDYATVIRGLLDGLPHDSYRTIVFENDIAALYRVFNCFVHIPVTSTAEAFGQTYLESLASHIPSVFTPSGVAPEFIRNGEQALLVPFRDSEPVLRAILHVLDNPVDAAAMAERGYQAVSEIFDVRQKVAALEQLYLENS